MALVGPTTPVSRAAQKESTDQSSAVRLKTRQTKPKIKNLLDEHFLLGKNSSQSCEEKESETKKLNENITQIDPLTAELVCRFAFSIHCILWDTMG